MLTIFTSPMTSSCLVQPRKRHKKLTFHLDQGRSPAIFSLMTSELVAVNSASRPLSCWSKTKSSAMWRGKTASSGRTSTQSWGWLTRPSQSEASLLCSTTWSTKNYCKTTCLLSIWLQKWTKKWKALIQNLPSVTTIRVSTQGTWFGILSSTNSCLEFSWMISRSMAYLWVFAVMQTKKLV